MSERTALLNAITADPDDDAPRLVYADWLDENCPDRVPSPAAGPSARADYIRVQCRLAAGAYDDPDYAELLERERDLIDWLNTHDPDPDPGLDGLIAATLFPPGGEWGEYRRGFLEEVGFDTYGPAAEETVVTLNEVLQRELPRTTARTLCLEDATDEEIALFACQPVFGRLRGLRLDYLAEGSEDEAVAAVARSARASGLRRLFLDLPLDTAGFEALAGSRYLGNLESLAMEYPVPAAALKILGSAKWFRNLRRLRLWTGGGDHFRALGELPPMPRLESLSLRGGFEPRPVGAKWFVASDSFPRLRHLDLDGVHMPPDIVAILARGRWPLRHLNLSGNDLRKAGAEALAAAKFAPSLQVLELRNGGITAGGVEALARSEALAGLRWLELTGNPIGPGGLAALARSEPLRGLRVLNLSATNTARAPLAAADVLAFLTGFAGTELRHLGLNDLPVGVRGARALAGSPKFANLRRLELSNCSLGERGTAELIGSSVLSGLVYLSLYRNKVGRGVGKLARPQVLPGLGYVQLGHGIPKGTANRLAKRPGIRFSFN
jgi:uncharacterized protein (TIGR02996 family)